MSVALGRTFFRRDESEGRWRDSQRIENPETMDDWPAANEWMIRGQVSGHWDEVFLADPCSPPQLPREPLNTPGSSRHGELPAQSQAIATLAALELQGSREGE